MYISRAQHLHGPVGTVFGEYPAFSQCLQCGTAAGRQCSEALVDLGVNAVHRIDHTTEVVASARCDRRRKISLADGMHQSPHQADGTGDCQRQHQQGELEHDEHGDAQRNADIGENAPHGVADISPIDADHRVSDLLAVMDHRMRDVVVRIEGNECAGLRLACVCRQRLKLVVLTVVRLCQEQDVSLGIRHREIGDFGMIRQQILQIGVHTPQVADRYVEAYGLVEVVGDRAGKDIRLVLDDRFQPRLDRTQRDPRQQRICGDQRRNSHESYADSEPGKSRGAAASANHRLLASAAASFAAVSRTETL